MTLYTILEVLEKNGYNTNQLFGWILPRAINFLTKRLIAKRVYYSVATDSRPVSKPQRKRGYTDKGYRRPSHMWLPRFIHETRVAKKEDKRSDVRTPPDYQWFPKKKNI
jgi:hypothetical protein